MSWPKAISISAARSASTRKRRSASPKSVSASTSRPTRRLRPDLKVLFITGYAENAVIGNGHLDHGMEVITKPFGTTALGAKIRYLIDKV